MTTTNGYTFLQLLIRQVHLLLSVYDIANVDIPKYSDYKNLHSYAKEIVAYVYSHELKLRSFTARETTSMYLSHLDDKRYTKTVKEYEMALRLSTNVADIYMVPATSGTIDQLCPTPGPPTPAPAPSGQRPHSSHIRQLADYCEDDDVSPDQFNDYVDTNEEPPWIHFFRQGGGRTPFCGGGGRWTWIWLPEQSPIWKRHQCIQLQVFQRDLQLL